MDIIVQPKPKSTKSNEILPLSVDMMEHSDKETDDTDTDDTILHPSPYLQTVLNYPCLILFLSLMVVLPLSYLGAINFSLGDPSGGQIVKDTIEAEQAQAFQKAAVFMNRVLKNGGGGDKDGKNKMDYGTGAPKENDITRDSESIV